MHMSVIVNQRATIRQELRIEGGATTTVFPLSESWLRSDSDHQNASKAVRARHIGDRFRSLMDYLYANVFVGTYWSVMDYYADESPPLRDILTDSQCDIVDRVLLEALRVAYSDFCAGRQRSWSVVRKTSDPRYYRKLVA